jgi:S-methylmethionine-dependent homocysteine/selenocysteine methylase
MGRELLRIGAPFRQPEWSALALLEAPAFVRQVHDSFVLAGADVITTNTYAVVPYHLGDDRFAARGRELAELAGRLGRAAADAALAVTGRTVSLAGSLPPVFGSYRPDLFRAEDAPRIFAPLVAGLSPFVDVWLAETQGSTREARAARAAVGAQDERPFWISFSLEDSEPEAVAAGQRAARLRSGESIAEAARAALDLRVQALLFNCSHAGVMEPALREAAAAFAERSPERRPALGVYANAFAPYAHARRGEANVILDSLRDDLEPADYVAFARRWREAGASIVGGCCGIGPGHIAALSRAFREEGVVTTNP